jgi:hypothetical protein
VSHSDLGTVVIATIYVLFTETWYARVNHRHIKANLDPVITKVTPRVVPSLLLQVISVFYKTNRKRICDICCSTVFYACSIVSWLFGNFTAKTCINEIEVNHA